MLAAALITAAGLSSRFNGTTGITKKELVVIEGRSVLSRVIEQFTTFSQVQTIIITLPPADLEQQARIVDQIFSSLDSRVTYRCVPGGETRQQSVHLGLEALTDAPPQYVLIHDGARPWVTQELIHRTFDAAMEFGAAAPGLSSRNALKGMDSSGFIDRHYRREEIVEIQTPQIFLFEEILKAHRLAAGDYERYIDDTEIYSDYGKKVAVVEGEATNRKITYRSDVEQYL